jgi:transposase-like protein
MKTTKEERQKKDAYQAKIKDLLKECGEHESLSEILREMTKNVIEVMYSEELKQHLGFEKQEKLAGRRVNYRNGSSKKVVTGSRGPIELAVPRDRNGEFEPVVVRKYQTDILGIEDKIISLYATGMTTRDISENIQEIYGHGISAETVSNITNRVIGEAKEWQSRPLKKAYSVCFMDGMVFKVKKDGLCQRVTLYVCIGIDLEGHKEVIGAYANSVESAKYWMSVMSDLKSRGLKDVLIFCTDNLPGLDESIKASFPDSDHQKCLVHQIRNSTKHVAFKDRKEICEDLKTIYTSPNANIGEEKLDAFCQKWDAKYSYIGRSWRTNWEYLSTFWGYPLEIRKLIYTTNPIESFNRYIRKVTKNRAIFPTEDALFKSVYLGICRLEKKWTGKIRDWGIIYSQLMVLFGERVQMGQE